MGLDTVEIIMTVEDRFGIEITDADAARCWRVGDLLDCVVAKLEEAPDAVARRWTWTNERILEVLRDIIAEEGGIPRDRITLDARFRDDLQIN